jgi:putative ABC transport system ATP-binding protein
MRVRLEQISKRYRGDSGDGTAVHALHPVTVEFPPGAVTAVTGPSGSGKSTLLHCAAGLDRPDAGRVLVGGTDLTALTERQLTAYRRSRIGFILQDGGLLPSLTAEQNAVLPLRLAGRRPDRGAVRSALEAVGLTPEQGRRRPSRLSGGQRQRVAVARALLSRPAVVFADEPTAALDPASADAIHELLRALAHDRGVTLVVVTHGAVPADHHIRLHEGRVAPQAHMRGAAPRAPEFGTSGHQEGSR